MTTGFEYLPSRTYNRDRAVERQCPLPCGISVHPVHRKVLDIQGVMLTSRFQNTFIAVKLIIQGYEN